MKSKSRKERIAAGSQWFSNQPEPLQRKMLEIGSVVAEQTATVQALKRTQSPEQVEALKLRLEEARKAESRLRAEAHDMLNRANAQADFDRGVGELERRIAGVDTLAVFVLQVHAVGVESFGLAYVMAERLGLVRDDGSVDLEALRSGHPGLFPDPPRTADNR